MPISPSPTVTLMPTVPVRGEDFAIFQPNSVTWVKALTSLQSEMNAFGAHFVTWQQALEGYKALSDQALSSAQSSSASASDSAALAAAEVPRATAAANGAEVFESQARDASILAASNAGIPSLAGNAERLLIVDNDELDVSLETVDQAIVGDISRSPEGVLNTPQWLICDGSVYSDTIYPDLFAVLGTTTLPNIPPVADDSINYYIKTGL